MWNKEVRSWIWERLVFLADRISPEDAFRATGLYIHLKKGEGWVLDDKGVQVWYKGEAEYKEHSHDGYEEEPHSRLLMDPLKTTFWRR